MVCSYSYDSKLLYSVRRRQTIRPEIERLFCASSQIPGNKHELDSNALIGISLGEVIQKPHHQFHRTISKALGTSPSSRNVAPKSTASKTFFGKFCVKLWTSIPGSWPSAVTTSNSVVSAGKDFWILPIDV